MFSLKLAKVTNNSRQLTARIQRKKMQWLEQFANDTAQAAAEIQKSSPQSSSAGQPPSVHSPAPNLETYGHVIDRSNDSVLVGPVYIPGAGNRPALPGVINRGGRVTTRVRRRGRQPVLRTRIIRARPFAVPAAMRAIPKLHANVRRGF